LPPAGLGGGGGVKRKKGEREEGSPNKVILERQSGDGPMSSLTGGEKKKEDNLGPLVKEERGEGKGKEGGVFILLSLSRTQGLGQGRGRKKKKNLRRKSVRTYILKGEGLPFYYNLDRGKEKVKEKRDKCISSKLHRERGKKTHSFFLVLLPIFLQGEKEKGWREDKNGGKSAPLIYPSLRGEEEGGGRRGAAPAEEGEKEGDLRWVLLGKTNAGERKERPGLRKGEGEDDIYLHLFHTRTYVEKGERKGKKI